jgi:hypothetical protein
MQKQRHNQKEFLSKDNARRRMFSVEIGIATAGEAAGVRRLEA